MREWVELELGCELADLLAAPGHPFADMRGAGLATTVTLIAESGDVRLRGDAAYARFRARLRSPAVRALPPAATAYTAAAIDRSTPASIGSRSPRPASTHERAPSSSARCRRERQNEKRVAPSSATSPTSSTGASTPGPNRRSRQRLDIGASNGSSATAT
jgi:hypothetical protein